MPTVPTKPCRGSCLHEIDEDVFEQRDCPETPQCDLLPCPNFGICSGVGPAWVLDGFGGRCCACSCTFGRTFALTIAEEPCPICFETGVRSVQYVCGHCVCAPCFGKGMCVEDSLECDEQFRPEDYGFQAVPGQQSDIRESEIMRWLASGAEGAMRYEDALRTAMDMEHSRVEASREALRRCPLCRSDAGVYVTTPTTRPRGHKAALNYVLKPEPQHAAA